MSAASIYDLSFTDNHGQTVALSDFADQPLLIVNTASKCGFTHHYDGLQELYQTYGPQGLVVLGFPCDQFGNQEPGDDADIEDFCRLNHGVTFPLSTKVEVNGAASEAVFVWLKEATDGADIAWNFTKFLVAPDGTTVTRYAPKTDPAKLTDDIEALLEDSAAR